MSHTPAPWHFDGHVIYDEASNEVAKTFRSIDGMTRDAAIIVRAVNAHEDLIKAMRSAIRALDCALDDTGLEISSAPIECVIDDLKQAIAKAEGE